MFDSFTFIASSGACFAITALLSMYWSVTDEERTGQRCAVRISDY